MEHEVQLAIFIVAASVAGLFFLFLFLYPVFKRFLYKYRTVRTYYKTVNRVALDNDFYLINAFRNKTADQEDFHIDHILIGDKFIYCIRDRYYDGAISAKNDDPSWIFYRKKQSRYISNPLMKNRIRVERLSLMSGIDQKIFISIVLINNDCFYNGYEQNSDEEFMVCLKRFPRLIKILESRDVPNLDPDQIAVAARDFAELNLHEKP